MIFRILGIDNLIISPIALFNKTKIRNFLDGIMAQRQIIFELQPKVKYIVK